MCRERIEGSRGAWSQRERAAELDGHLPARRLVAMESKCELGDAGGVKTGMDHLEGSGLLADEQHRLASSEELRDDVGDRLALAGAWRTVHDKASSIPRGDDALALAGIGVADGEHLFGRSRSEEHTSELQ